MAKIKRFRGWVQKNLRNVFLVICMMFVVVALWFASLFYGAIVVLAKETMLQSLIQAEATVIGFSGIIAVYALTSFDSRIDRLEEQKFKLERSDSTNVVKKWNDRIKDINKHKRGTINSILYMMSFLFSSLLLSILALGIADSLWSFSFCVLGIDLFFSSIFMLILMFYELREVAENSLSE